jgi:hypothetical protein
MGVPPMSYTGVPPVCVVSCVSVLGGNCNSRSKDTGRMPVRLMGKMPMLRLRTGVLRGPLDTTIVKSPYE